MSWAGGMGRNLIDGGRLGLLQRDKQSFGLSRLLPSEPLFSFLPDWSSVRRLRRPEIRPLLRGDRGMEDPRHAPCWVTWRRHQERLPYVHPPYPDTMRSLLQQVRPVAGPVRWKSGVSGIGPSVRAGHVRQPPASQPGGFLPQALPELRWALVDRPDVPLVRWHQWRAGQESNLRRDINRPSTLTE